eukprot:Plantae.Rhodophyta-Purpureofilum_apyrenoidigerum.ctg14079.p1 GENE.Plantae.Rhodophyta-Purpureofilum_apyrenoidigerum.ctg14079~~Plantae.Rhodophyta-Purpureofilum_apyrenoidigerum.ctg14079.p1  ORF type:complete len:370 (-),score=58.07 Plantae.Rhodophyta-Purpureofilum_apyrenoidigerum.ctg14079:1195-2304(-)
MGYVSFKSGGRRELKISLIGSLSASLCLFIAMCMFPELSPIGATTGQDYITSRAPILPKNRRSSSQGAGFKSTVPECAKKFEGRAQTAFMFHISHSGSTALITQLASHPDVGNHTGWHNLEPLTRYGGEFENEREHVRGIYAHAEKAGQMGVLKYNGLSVLKNPTQWKELLKENNSRILYMHRTNHVKRAVGRYPYRYMHYNGHFGGRMAGEEVNCYNDEGQNVCQFEVDPASIHCMLKRSYKVDKEQQQQLDAVTDENACVMEIVYEDFLYTPDKVLDNVLEFLGLDKRETHTGREKSTNDNLCDVVQNYADLCAAFNECSRWSWMLNDEVNGCTCRNFEYKSLGGDDKNPLCNLAPLSKNEDPWCSA